MDPVSMYKIQAINKHKRQQLLTSLVLYTLTALTSCLFFVSPFWYPPLRATANVFLYISFPKIIPLFFSSKVVFIVGNLIIIFLVGEFKIYTVPRYASRCYNNHEHVASDKILQNFNMIGGEWKKPSKDKLLNANNCKDEGHQEINLTKEVARSNKDPLLTNIHNVKKVVVSPSTPKQEEISDSTERNWRTEKMDWKKKSYEEKSNLSIRDLNKMADDFIARVNKQRKLESYIP